VKFPEYSNVSPFARSGSVLVVHGTLQKYNVDDLGRSSSLMVLTGDTTRQINLPEALMATLPTSVPPGDTIDAVVAPVSGSTAELPVYRLISLRDSKNRMYAAFNPIYDRFVHVEGTIQSILYDQAGVITGVVLNNGNTVALTAQQAKQQEVAVGDPLTADGHSVPAPNGFLYVQAQEVNGVSMRVYLPATGWGVRIVSDESDNGGDAGDGQ
jgi:hypothetical protein